MTIAPLAWLPAVCSTAAWEKIFSDDPRLGFLSHVTQTAAKIASGGLDPAKGARMILNDRVDAALCAAFLVITWAVIISSARVWLTKGGVAEGRTPVRPYPRVAENSGGAP